MDYRPTLRTQTDLEDAWRHLMGPLGFSSPSLWFVLITADDELFPHVTQIDEAATPPSPDEVAGLADLMAELRDEFAPGGRIAFLRSRPGRRGITAEDRAWARALYDVGRHAGIPIEVVHRACDHDLVPIPMDDALPDSAA